MVQALPPSELPQAEIVVTGKALPDPSAERAYAVSLIDRKQLTNAPSNRLDQILKSVPGLQLFRRSDSTSGHPTSQGVTLRALGGNASSRTLLVLDGVPQADPFGGGVIWPAYDPAGLDEVRVIRGGGTVPYGPGALAGIIEMTSLAAAGVTGSAEVGSRGSATARAFVGAPVGASLLTLNGQAARSRGFIPVTQGTRGAVDQPSPYREGNVRARWIAPLSDHVEVQAGGLAFIDVRERGLPFTGNRSRGADASLRLVGMGSWQWSATGYAQWRNLRSRFASVNEQRTTAAPVAVQDSVPSRGYGGSVEARPPLAGGVELRLGADARFTTGQSREFYAFVGDQPSRRRIAGGRSGSMGMFAEAAVTRGLLTLSGGARLDHWSISDGKLVELLLASGEVSRDDHYASRSGWRPTVRAGAALDAGAGFSLRSAAYLGWRLPTLNELFRPFRAGPNATAANPQLDPERIAGAEAGVDYRHGPFQLSLTAFANRLSGAIANVTLGAGPGIFPGVGFVAGDYRQRQNLDAVDVSGIEASAEGRRGPWSLRLGAGFSDARVRSSETAAGLDRLRPAQTPRVTMSGELGWQQGQRAASLLLRHVGAQFEDDLNRIRLKPATTLDAFATWPLTSRFTLVSRAENLFNSVVIAGAESDGTLERATPRTLWIGLRFVGF